MIIIHIIQDVNEEWSISNRFPSILTEKNDSTGEILHCILFWYWYNILLFFSVLGSVTFDVDDRDRFLFNPERKINYSIPILHFFLKAVRVFILRVSFSMILRLKSGPTIPPLFIIFNFVSLCQQIKTNICFFANLPMITIFD